jgi:hypothetical protein
MSDIPKKKYLKYLWSDLDHTDIFNLLNGVFPMHLVHAMVNMGHQTYSGDFLQNLVKTTGLFGDQKVELITLLTSKSGCVRPAELYNLFKKAVFLIEKKINLEEEPLKIPGEKGREILHKRLAKIRSHFMKASALLEEYSEEVCLFLEIIFRSHEAVESLKYSLRTTNPSSVVFPKESSFFSKEQKMGDVFLTLLRLIYNGKLLDALKKAYEESTPVDLPVIQNTTGATGEEAEMTLQEGLKKLYGKGVKIHTGVYIRFPDGKVAERDAVVVDGKNLLAVIECKANPQTGFSCAEKQVELTQEALEEGGIFYMDRKCKVPIECTYTRETKFILASPGRFYPFSYKIMTSPVLLKRSILQVVAHMYSIEQGGKGLPMGILEEAIKTICSSIVPIVPDWDYRISYNESADATFIQFVGQPTYEKVTRSVKIQKLTAEVLAQFL